MNNTNIDQTLTEFNDAFKALLEQAHRPVAQEITQFVEFRAKDGGTNNGKGILWFGEGNVKQFVYNEKPDRFFSSEHIELFKDRTLIIGGVPILSSTELGSSVTKSNLRELGRLRGLIVDGSMVIDQYIYYNKENNRLGLGTDTPNAGFSVAEEGIEVVLGARDQTRGMVGTHASIPFDIVTDNTARISVSPDGNIQLGNTEQAPIQVAIHGKLSIGVKNPDPNVDLHVNGSVRLNGRMQSYASTPPDYGAYTRGDIVWNSEPEIKKYIGWVCAKSGVPGTWLPFGEIKERDR